jgi:hypothetical protein
MEIKEMFDTIKQKRENIKDIKDDILQAEMGVEDKIISSIFYLPSQSYGIFIKDIIKEELGAINTVKGDGYTDEFGAFNIKVCVNNKPIVIAKQTSIYDEVDNYILVHVDYQGQDISFYTIPKNILLKASNTCPDHGSVTKGFTEEYSAIFYKEEVEKYRIEFR